MGWFKNLFQPKVEPPKSSTKVHVKQSLHATIIRACTNCGACGTDASGKDVGRTCPSCGATRPQNENLGQIWSKLKSAD